MKYNENDFCLILAGGKGRRLWPCSREKCPKQFLDFFSTGKTLLQQTYERMTGIVPEENIYISTNHEYEHLVEEQLPGISRESRAKYSAWTGMMTELAAVRALTVMSPREGEQSMRM